jgi:hypothetical protein
MRTHKINPTITVIMETVGSNQDKIARAINSFLAQTYDRAKLLLINYHPQRLQLAGVPATARIELLNAEDVFLRHVHQHMHNLKQIDTDCWTVLDDDDWLEPDHLAQLVENWNRHTDRTDAPLLACGQNYQVHYADGVKPLKFRGWAVTLFERLSPQEVDLCYRMFPPDNVLGSDTWIAGNSYFDQRVFDGRPTYHWDRIGSNHASQHETNRGITPHEKFLQALNFWRIKLAARAAELKPVVLTTV